MTPAVSIIIPVYNTEKYLREALDTVLAQTMTEIEVLCVDDGSTDSSLDILHEYAAKDPRVSVFTQDHQFAGAARNLGIKHAAGKYLLFLDSDDIFPPDLAAKSFARAEETNADICIFGGELFFEDTGEHRPSPNLCRRELCPGDVFSAKNHPNEIFWVSTPSPWNKLYRREFITGDGIEFQTVRSCNDLSFVMTALACAERVTLLDEPLILYRQRSTSLQHTQDKNPLAFYDALLELRAQLTARGLYEPLKDAYKVFAAEYCLYNLSTMKTLSGFAKVYSGLRENAIPELGLDDLPEWADQRSPYYRPAARIPEIQELSPGTYIARYESGCLKKGFAPETESERFLLDVLKERERIRDEEIQTIMNSPSVKIGRAITAPMRKIRDLLRKS